MTEPYYADATVQVYAGDCLDVLAQLDDASVDSVVTDPPYGLEFMGREWDSFRAQRDPRTAGRSGAGAVIGGAGIGNDKSTPGGRSRASFGGKRPSTWRCDTCGKRNQFRNAHMADAPDCAGTWVAEVIDPTAPSPLAPFQAWCESWSRECLRVLRPGGHLLAFGGTRTSHRLACAIEDAGFEIRDSLAWIYGQGFPKSLNVSAAIDKRPGVLRHAEFAADLRQAMAAKGYTNTFDVAEAVIGRRTGAVANWQKYQFPEARWWRGLCDLLDMDDAKWGPVIAEAERVRTGVHANGLHTGTAGVGAGGTAQDRRDIPATDDAATWQGWGTALKPAHEPIVVARKPLTGTVAANVLAHGVGALNIDGCRVGVSESDPLRKATFVGSDPGAAGETMGDGWAQQGQNVPMWNGAGRWPANVVLDESQAAVLDAMSGELTSVGGFAKSTGAFGKGGIYGDATGIVDDTRTGTGFGDSGGASRFFYTAKAGSAERLKLDGVAHPTVKPLSLMRWLVRLVTPAGGVCLEPFAGSGTTVEACILEGFRCIAIERETDYLPLITQRIHRRRDPAAYVAASGDDGGLFDLLDVDPDGNSLNRGPELRERPASTDLGGMNDDGWKPKPVVQRRYRDGAA